MHLDSNRLHGNMEHHRLASFSELCCDFLQPPPPPPVACVWKGPEKSLPVFLLQYVIPSFEQVRAQLGNWSTNVIYIMRHNKTYLNKYVVNDFGCALRRVRPSSK